MTTLLKGSLDAVSSRRGETRFVDDALRILLTHGCNLGLSGVARQQDALHSPVTRAAQVHD